MKKENRYKFLNDKNQHLHTLDGKPLMGTSSVSDVLNKPLHWWAVGVALSELGWTKIQEDEFFLPDEVKIKAEELGLKFKKGGQGKVLIPKEIRLEFVKPVFDEIKGLSDEDYLSLLDRAYSAHSRSKDKSAKEGTDLHAILEDYVKLHMSGAKIDESKLHPRILPFVEWTKREVKRFLWSEVHCYSEKHHLGGISDVGYETNDGQYGILDFKSSKAVYLSQLWQCAGYDIQITENGGFTADGDLVFTLDKPISQYAVLAFGMENPEPKFMYDVNGAKEAFLAELLLSNKIKQYESNTNKNIYKKRSLPKNG